MCLHIFPKPTHFRTAFSPFFLRPSRGGCRPPGHPRIKAFGLAKKHQKLFYYLIAPRRPPGLVQKPSKIVTKTEPKSIKKSIQNRSKNHKNPSRIVPKGRQNEARRHKKVKLCVKERPRGRFPRYPVTLGDQLEGQNVTFMLKNNLKRPPRGIRRRFERVPKMTSRRKALKIDFALIFGGFRDPQGKKKCGPSLELSPSFGF